MPRSHHISLLVAAVAVAIVSLSGCGSGGASTQPASGQTLNLFIWGNYITEGVKKEFKDRTGITINEDNYDANEKLHEKLAAGDAEYDLCVPSDYMVRILIAEKLIQPIDRSQVPNFKNVDPRFLHRSFDPENKYSVPYFWGTTGLAYNKEKVSPPVDSWSVVWDEKYKQKILMLDDMRECFAVALKLNGKSLNTPDAKSLDAAAGLLRKQKPLVKLYWSEDSDQKLKNGEVVLAHLYSGQAGKLMLSDPRFGYVIPKEGATIWIDQMCIPAKAPHVAAALKFIDFIHDPQINAQIVNEMCYPSTNAEAKKFVKPEVLANEAIYPTDETMKRCESMTDVGDAATQSMEKLWTQIKASQ